MSGAIARKSIGTLFAACVLAVLAVAAPAAAAPRATSAMFPAAVRIVLVREGGFAGTQDSYVVGRETDGGRRSLRLAATRDFLRLRNSYQPQNSCCDRFAYHLTVTYRGGFRKTVDTVQGTPAPSILWDVITEVQRVGGTRQAQHR